jgi:hypothetical protein
LPNIKLSLLELITIGEWEDAGKPEDFDMRKGFYHVMNAIKNYRNIHRVCKTEFLCIMCSFYPPPPNQSMPQGLAVIFSHHQVCVKKKKGGHFLGAKSESRISG